jgi:hypothetical protein
MAALTTASANDVLNYVLRGLAPSWGGATTLYVSLHSGAVGSGGDQTTNEITYTGYARVAIARNNITGEFATASGGATDNDNLITFGNATAGSFPISVTHAAIGENASGAGTAILTTPLNSTLVINTNIQPNVPAGAFDVAAS